MMMSTPFAFDILVENSTRTVVDGDGMHVRVWPSPKDLQREPLSLCDQAAAWLH